MVGPDQSEISTQAVDPHRSVNELDEDVLLTVLSAFKNGDFDARMPLGWTGVAGKIADTLNDVIAANQTLGDELARVVRRQRGQLLPAGRAAGLRPGPIESIDSVNSLIDDLVRPTSEMQRVIGAVADGDLSKNLAGRGGRRGARAEGHHQRDGRSARPVCLGGDARAVSAGNSSRRAVLLMRVAGKRSRLLRATSPDGSD